MLFELQRVCLNSFSHDSLNILIVTLLNLRRKLWCLSSWASYFYCFVSQSLEKSSKSLKVTHLDQNRDRRAQGHLTGSASTWTTPSLTWAINWDSQFTDFKIAWCPIKCYPDMKDRSNYFWNFTFLSIK